MSENSPRWPGANGSPGLDFSPWRKSADGDTAVHAADDDQETRIQPAVPQKETAEETGDPDRADESNRSAAEPAAGESAYRDGTAPAASPTTPDDATRITPSLSERAVSAAKAWATRPVPRVAPVAVSTAVPSTNPARAAGDVAEASVARGAAAVDQQVRPVRSTRRTRKARLRLARIDPWSVMKTTFLFAIAFGIMLVVATFVVWSVLAGSGAIQAANEFLNTLLGDQDTTFDIGGILSLNRILGFAAVVAAIDVVILTALATLAAFLYNLAATVMGGLEVTLAED